MLPLVAFALATTVEFADRTWNVRGGTGGPGPNHWSDAADAVWVDADGALHLTIRATADGTWACTEVWLDDPTTFGPHTFYVDSRFDAYDPNVVLGLFTYQDDTHEIDIELAKWGAPAGDTLWYTVQPPDADSQWSAAPTLSGSYTTHQFDWQPGGVHFRSWHGHYPEPPDSSWVFGDYTTTAAHVPDATAAMPVHMNLWLVNGRAPTDGQDVEVVIRGAVIPADAPEDTGPTDSGTSPNDSAGPDDTGTPKDRAGCGCATPGAAVATGLAPAGLLLLAARRRRCSRWTGGSR